MISHPNVHVEEFILWVREFYGVDTRKLSSRWWGRLLQKMPFFKMVGIQLGSSIWINDVDNDHDGKRDYWHDEHPYGCISAITHELWHVLQKRTNKFARWRYLQPQVYALFMLPGFVWSAVVGSWLALLWGVLLLWFLMPGHASERLRLEAEAYSWNRLVVSLLTDHNLAALALQQDEIIKVLTSGTYYWPTRQKGEAARFLEGYEGIPSTEPILITQIKQTIHEIKNN